MSGERDLSILLQNLAPVLHPDEFVFCTIDPGCIPAGVDPIATMREEEGLTLVVPRRIAEQMGLPYTFPCARITLSVNSDLDAVGLTAAISNALASEHIPCNLIAGYYHDHLFVPYAEADHVMKILSSLFSAGRK